MVLQLVGRPQEPQLPGAINLLGGGATAGVQQQLQQTSSGPRRIWIESCGDTDILQEDPDALLETQNRNCAMFKFATQYPY